MKSLNSDSIDRLYAGFKSKYPTIARTVTNRAAAELAGEADALHHLRRHRFDLARAVLVVNRAAPVADGGFMHIVPKGELPNPDAGITQVLDDKALDSIIYNIRADQKKLGNRWPGVYLGFEHDVYNPEKSSQAAGWLKNWEKRGDGIWASDEDLTDIGREAIKNKRFKFTSFCADPKDTEKLDGNRVRILKLDTVGLTNYANGRDILTPIVNRSGDARPGDPSSKELTPERAHEVFAALVSGLQREYGWGFDQAYAKAKSRFPEIYSVMGLAGQDQSAATTRMANDPAIAGEITNRAKRIDAETGCGLSRAFRQAQAEFIAVRPANAGETAAQRITNRAHEFQKQWPHYSFATCLKLAQDAESTPEEIRSRSIRRGH